MIRTALAALVAAFLLPQPAQAAACMDHAAMVKYLADKFKEQPVAVGLSGGVPPIVIELYVSRDSGSWSLVGTTPDRASCIIGSGIAMTLVPVGKDLQPEF